MLKLRNALIPIRELGSENLKLLGVITGGHFVIHWFQQLFPVLLPSVKAGLGLNDVQVGALTSARQMAQGTLNLPSGLLADSLVRHRALILASSLVIMGLAYLLFGKAPSFVWLLFAAGLVGLGSEVWHPAAAATLSNRFPERRATALAVHGMGATSSDTITPLVMGALLVTFPWQNVLALQIVPAFLVGLLVLRGLRGIFTGAGSQASRSAQIREIGELARNPVFLTISAARGLTQMGRLVVLTFLPIYLQEHLGYSPFILGVHIMLLHAMGTISQPILGFLSDRFGRKAVLLPFVYYAGVAVPAFGGCSGRDPAWAGDYCYWSFLLHADEHHQCSRDGRGRIKDPGHFLWSHFGVNSTLCNSNAYSGGLSHRLIRDSLGIFFGRRISASCRPCDIPFETLSRVKNRRRSRWLTRMATPWSRALPGAPVPASRACRATLV